MTTVPAVREKIRDLDELASELARHREQGRRVVQCHGVFDLLHIGHIRHLERARAMGDVLVVTLTPDHHVNKGPHRPAFPQDLRAEALAALSCVDYVAINRWPMAVEAIRMLRPNLYVKGTDYRDAAKDVTGGISVEEDAVRSVGGALAFTDEIVFSSSALLNRHLPSFSRHVADYLEGFRARYSIDDVKKALEGAAGLKVLVVGETILDEYQYCTAIGKSSKEPTLVVRLLSEEKFAGGILAVCNHVANFAGQVGLLTFLGAQDSHEDFVRARLPEKVEKRFLLQEGATTIVKRRFVESYFFTKLFEVYDFNDKPLGEKDTAAFCAALREMLPRYDLVVVFDFGHGLLQRPAIELLCREAKFLAVNTQSNAGNLGFNTISRYERADYVCIAENELRLEARDREADLRLLVTEAARRLQCSRMVVTRGGRGALCYDARDGFFEVPALAGQVVDRVGAGDAFLSVTSLCAAQGVPMELLGFIGNLVGAQAVGTVGHRSSVERASLIKHAESVLK
jgi:rfaE bifunctional protein nucleotidyltransferase chain/domain